MYNLNVNHYYFINLLLPVTNGCNFRKQETFRLKCVVVKEKMNCLCLECNHHTLHTYHDAKKLYHIVFIISFIFLSFLTYL